MSIAVNTSINGEANAYLGEMKGTIKTVVYVPTCLLTSIDISLYSYKVAELDHIEAIAHSVGIIEGPKRSGRKPKIK